jgi:hypothetical protein
MAQTLGGGSFTSLAGRVARTNWWLIGAVLLGIASWVAVITAARAII